MRELLRSAARSRTGTTVALAVVGYQLVQQIHGVVGLHPELIELSSKVESLGEIAEQLRAELDQYRLEAIGAKAGAGEEAQHAST